MHFAWDNQHLGPYMEWVVRFIEHASISRCVSTQTFSVRVLFTWVVVTKSVPNPGTVLEEDRADPLIQLSGNHRTVPSTQQKPPGSPEAMQPDPLRTHTKYSLVDLIVTPTHWVLQRFHVGPLSSFLSYFLSVRKTEILIFKRRWWWQVEWCACNFTFSSHQVMSGL